MSTTVALDFAVADIAYHVDAMKGIRKGRIKDVKVSVVASGTTITYDIVFVQSKYGSATVESTELYADFATASTAYEIIVESV